MSQSIFTQNKLNKYIVCFKIVYFDLLLLLLWWLYVLLSYIYRAIQTFGIHCNSFIEVIHVSHSRNVWECGQMLPWARPLCAYHPLLYRELWDVQHQPFYRFTLWLRPKVCLCWAFMSVYSLGCALENPLVATSQLPFYSFANLDKVQFHQAWVSWYLYQTRWFIPVPKTPMQQ